MGGQKQRGVRKARAEVCGRWLRGAALKGGPLKQNEAQNGTAHWSRRRQRPPRTHHIQVVHRQRLGGVEALGALGAAEVLLALVQDECLLVLQAAAARMENSGGSRRQAAAA